MNTDRTITALTILIATPAGLFFSFLHGAIAAGIGRVIGRMIAG